MTYQQGQIIRARGARQRIERVLSESWLMDGGRDDVMVLMTRQLDETHLHPQGSHLYLEMGEVETVGLEEEREVVA